MEKRGIADMDDDKLKHIKMFLYDEIKKYEAIKEPLTGAELGRLELAKEMYERIT